MDKENRSPGAASPVKVATDALDKAETDASSSKKTEAALSEQADIAERELTLARLQLDSAVKAVVASDAAVVRLVHDYQTAQATYFDRCRVITALSELGCAPLSSWGEGCDGSGPFPAAAQAWLSAITALRTNPDAELPQE